MRTYDRQGQPISMDDWARLLESNLYKRVAWSEVGDVIVSTVWLGLDHQYGDGPPLIFETMCFGGALDQEPFRYATEEQALAGHAEMVTMVKTMLDVAAEGGAEEPVRERADNADLT